MKKIMLLMVPLFLLLFSCSKDDAVMPPVNEGEWLNKERGIVVASDLRCDFYVVETRYGYAVLRTWGGFPPVYGAVLYGDFSSWGVRTFYNRSEGYLMNADVRDYRTSYFSALDQMNWNCRSGI
jgi:hypothetical protein